MCERIETYNLQLLYRLYSKYFNNVFRVNKWSNIGPFGSTYKKNKNKKTVKIGYVKYFLIVFKQVTKKFD